MSTPPTSPSGYTAVVHFPSPKSPPQQRDAALESLLQTATALQGHRSSVVLRRASDTTSELFLVLTFDNHDSWRRWESSSPAREAIARLDELTGTPGDGHLLNSIAGWFDLPGPAA